MTVGSFVLVAMVHPEQVPKSFRRRRLEWPLHVTLLPWFEVLDAEGFMHDLNRLVPQEQSFIAEVGEDALFGPNRDVPVSLIKNREPFAIMHYFLLTILEKHDGVFSASSNWTKKDYTPHVTHHGDERLHPGESFRVNNVAVVKLLNDDMCEVVNVIPLGAEA